MALGSARAKARGLELRRLGLRRLVGNAVHRFRYKTLREEESHREGMDGSFIDNIHPYMSILTCTHIAYILTCSSSHVRISHRLISCAVTYSGLHSSFFFFKESLIAFTLCRVWTAFELHIQLSSYHSLNCEPNSFIQLLKQLKKTQSARSRTESLQPIPPMNKGLMSGILFLFNSG